MAHPDDPDDFDLTVLEDTRETFAEHLGDYASLDDYFRGQLEELLVPGGLWLLECLDMHEVRQRFEGGRYRYFVARGGLPDRGVTAPPDAVRCAHGSPAAGSSMRLSASTT
ncbi:MAG TPA: hypothetical protein VGB85_15610, partial [Nannocystis sp.]